MWWEPEISWLNTKSFDCWSSKIFGILLFQRTPFFSYPACITPWGALNRGQEEKDSIAYTSFTSGPGQVQTPSDQSVRVLSLLEHMQRRACDRSLVCEERGIWCSVVYLSGVQTSIAGILETSTLCVCLCMFMYVYVCVCLCVFMYVYVCMQFLW